MVISSLTLSVLTCVCGIDVVLILFSPHSIDQRWPTRYRLIDRFFIGLVFMQGSIDRFRFFYNQASIAHRSGRLTVELSFARQNGQYDLIPRLLSMKTRWSTMEQAGWLTFKTKQPDVEVSVCSGTAVHIGNKTQSTSYHLSWLEQEWDLFASLPTCQAFCSLS